MVLGFDDVEALIFISVEKFEQQGDGGVGDAVVPMCTTLVVLLFQHSLPNCFFIAFASSLYVNFVHFFSVAKCDCALKAILVRSASAFETQYLLCLLWMAY